MSHQLTFADSEFSSKRRQTRKEIFLSRMEQILPWQNMVEVIEPFYPKAGNGRRPYPLETMLRIHCMQHWYNLSDGAMEDALYEIASMRLFARLSLDSALPDRTTIMNFRHLLEQHQLARQLFKTINRWLAEAGVMMTQGTLVDATIIEADLAPPFPDSFCILSWHCCKVSDEAAFCLIQRPYISKTLLTRRISPRGSP